MQNESGLLCSNHSAKTQVAKVTQTLMRRTDCTIKDVHVSCRRKWKTFRGDRGLLEEAAWGWGNYCRSPSTEWLEAEWSLVSHQQCEPRVHGGQLDVKKKGRKLLAYQMNDNANVPDRAYSNKFGGRRNESILILHKRKLSLKWLKIELKITLVVNG